MDSRFVRRWMYTLQAVQTALNTQNHRAIQALPYHRGDVCGIRLINMDSKVGPNGTCCRDRVKALIDYQFCESLECIKETKTTLIYQVQ